MAFRDTDTFMPYLDFRLGTKKLAFTQRLTSRPLDGPPFVQSFNVRRRVRCFAASEWTATMYDLSGELFEELLIAQNLGNTSEIGRVSYSMGFTSSSGEFERYPTVYGIVKRVSPTYMREGVRVTVEGVDLGMEEARTAISISAVTQPSAKWGVKDWVESAFAEAGMAVLVEVKPVGALDGVDLTGFAAYVGDPDNDNAARLMSRIAARSASGDLSTISVNDFFSVVTDYLSQATGGMDVRMRIDGMNSNGVLNVTVVVGGYSEDDVERRYVVNSQLKKEESDCIAVENFSVALDPMAPQVFMPRSETVKLVNRLTREITEVSYSPDDEDGVAVGPSILTVKSQTGLRRLGPSAWPGASAEEQRAVRILENPASFDRRVVEATRRELTRKFNRFPMQGTMTVHFPPQDLIPYTYAGVKVLTNKGKDPITSGRYLVRDVNYEYSQGTFKATASVLKSGGASTPGENGLGAKVGTLRGADE